MRELNVALAQFDAINAANFEEVNENITNMVLRMESAVKENPNLDIFISPECSLQGSDDNWLSVLLKLDGEHINRLCAKCKELKIWGVFNPWVKPDDNKFCYNMSIIINNKGQIVHKYKKMNPWVPGETVTPGNELNICTGPYGLKIATFLSSDGEYPEMWNLAKKNGAQLIIRQSHYMLPFDDAYLITNRAAAMVSGAHVIGCNAVGMDVYAYIGCSMVVDPTGIVLKMAPKGVGCILHAKFNINL